MTRGFQAGLPRAWQAASDEAARAAMGALRRRRDIENRCPQKLRVLEDLFVLHHGSPVLVYTGSNAMARDVSLRFLVPAITSETGRAERARILERFAAGTYSAVVSNRVLDEGIDVPAVKVAVVLGGLAGQRLALYRKGAGRVRSDLHTGEGRILAGNLRRAGAFCGLLDELSEYNSARQGAGEIRDRVFTLAARHHPLLSRPGGLSGKGEAWVKESIAAELGLPWEQIAQALYSDLAENHRLVRFAAETEPRVLLSRYNIEQVRAALRDAVSLRIRAEADFKRILRFAKLARLMHSISRDESGAGYCVVLAACRTSHEAGNCVRERACQPGS